MNVIRSFTLKSLKRNKKRTIVTILGVTISAAMITAVTIFVSSLVGMIQRSTIADVGNWHAEIKTVESQNIENIREGDGIDTAVLSRNLGYAPVVDSDTYRKQYLFVRQYGANGFDNMSIRLVSGRLPQNSGEVLVSSSLIDEGTDYAIGSKIELELGDIMLKDIKAQDNDYLPYEYDENGKVISEPVFSPTGTEQFTVVGVMDPPGFERSWSAGYAVLGYIDEDSLAPNDKVDVYVALSSVSRDIYDDMPALADKAGATGGVKFNDDLLRYHGIVKEDNVYAFLQGFMAVIILIIMVSSISLIYNAFAISVAERSKQLGLLASVGATRRQKRSSVYYEGLFIGIIGVPLGILAGIAGMAITLAAIQPLLGSFLSVSPDVRLTLVVPPLAVAATVVLSAITIFISAWIPARRASKITPIDAIRLTREVKLTRRAVRTSRFFRRLFGFEAEIALKNLKRSRKKYRATILSLAISLVLFLTVSSYTSMTDQLSGATYDGYNYDIAVYYSDAHPAEREKLDKSISEFDLINEYTSLYSLQGSISLTEDQLSDDAREYVLYQVFSTKSGKIDLMAAVIGLDDESFARYAADVGVNAAEFADAQHPKAILINYGQSNIYLDSNNVKRAAGDILSANAGDTLAFSAGQPQEGSADITDATFVIGALTQERPMGVLIEGMANIKLVVPDDVWSSVVNSLSAQRLEQLRDFNVTSYESYMTTSDDQKLEKQIGEVTDGHGANVFNIKSAARSEQNLQLFLGVFVYGFIILISLICIANIFNTVSTNIALRRREFAMLRSVGMTPKSFGKMIRFESIFYGLKGMLYGLPISVAVAFLLFGMQQSVMSSEFTLPWVSYGVAVLMILVIVFVTMLYSTAKIKKENILDALKEETT